MIFFEARNHDTWNTSFKTVKFKHIEGTNLWLNKTESVL